MKEIMKLAKVPIKVSISIILLRATNSLRQEMSDSTKFLLIKCKFSDKFKA